MASRPRPAGSTSDLDRKQRGVRPGPAAGPAGSWPGRSVDGPRPDGLRNAFPVSSRRSPKLCSVIATESVLSFRTRAACPISRSGFRRLHDGVPDGRDDRSRGYRRRTASSEALTESLLPVSWRRSRATGINEGHFPPGPGQPTIPCYPGGPEPSKESAPMPAPSRRWPMSILCAAASLALAGFSAAPAARLRTPDNCRPPLGRPGQPGQRRRHTLAAAPQPSLRNLVQQRHPLTGTGEMAPAVPPRPLTRVTSRAWTSRRSSTRAAPPSTGPRWPRPASASPR